ncbi:hypothetical protein Ait01nite_010920 [Actinoplanes italicus]|uniref:Uncharacterized protein DUF998 n=1 Tax=Actinoplanes italicus TaxID=113567 RepID=A0A2T0KGH3_9ACTN|nr:DUF998 domain-containing protein [Actinoplanes italicus]PRX22531.1 uncharacterized protein DUF998 [Actinoplanes italicus]GIE28047.1 hypothetical protein Ait01nite_010920 [Actinoplanes italicus]
MKMKNDTAPAAGTHSITSPRVALAVAGPLWAAVSLAQAATRDGFDLMRHPLSLLSTGALGGVQIANFVVAGVLMVVGAGSLAGTWAPRLARIAGFGMIAAGLLVMDPGGGFPAGHDEVPATMSWHALGHMAAGTVSFTALIAACYVLAKQAATRASAVAAALSGTALLAGWLWAMSGGTAGTLTLAVGAIAAMLFLSWTALRSR